MTKQNSIFNVKNCRDAIQKGNLKRLKKLITEENVNEPLIGGVTPIHLAAIDGNIEVVSYLLQLGADLKTRDFNGKGVFYYASKNKEVYEVSQYLFLAIFANELVEDKALLFKEYETFTFLINYLVASYESQKKNLDAITQKSRKFIKKKISKLKDICGRLNISLKTQTDVINILERSGINEFCYVKDLLLIVCAFGNTEILEYLIKCKKKIIENELFKENLSEALFLEKSEKIMKKYVNQKDSTGWTPLHEACEFGHKDIVKILMKNGARADIVSEAKMDGLFIAICSENIEVLDVLFDMGVISQFDNNGLQKLFKDILTRQMCGSEGNNKKISSKVMNLLCKKGLFSVKLEKERNFFHFAALNFDINFKNLKINEEDLQQEDVGNYTPLNLAMMKNNLVMVNFLLSKMKFIVTSDKNLMILKGLMKKEHIKKDIKKSVFNELVKEIKSGRKKLEKICPSGSSFFDEIILKVDSKSFDTSRDDILAAIENNEVKKLKSFDSQVLSNFSYDDGRSLLWHVTKNCKEEIAVYLLELGIFDQNEIDKKNSGDSLLMLACDNGLNKLARRLIERKVDITVLNNIGIDIYHKACMTDNKDILKYLKENFKNDWKKQINKEFGNCGQNLLILAAYYASNNVISFLINEGINVDQTDKLGKTAIMYAYDFENYEAMQLLLNAGADPKEEYTERANLKKVKIWINNREKRINGGVSNKTKVLSDKICKEEFNQDGDMVIG